MTNQSRAVGMTAIDLWLFTCSTSSRTSLVAHILPKGFTKSRAYGGFSCTKRREYLDRCRELLSERDEHQIA